MTPPPRAPSQDVAEPVGPREWQRCGLCDEREPLSWIDLRSSATVRKVAVCALCFLARQPAALV